jgi:hypothetical protein
VIVPDFYYHQYFDQILSQKLEGQRYLLPFFEDITAGVRAKKKIHRFFFRGWNSWKYSQKSETFHLPVRNYRKQQFPRLAFEPAPWHDASDEEEDNDIERRDTRDSDAGNSNATDTITNKVVSPLKQHGGLYFMEYSKLYGHDLGKGVIPFLLDLGRSRHYINDLSLSHSHVTRKCLSLVEAKTRQGDCWDLFGDTIIDCEAREHAVDYARKYWIKHLSSSQNDEELLYAVISFVHQVGVNSSDIEQIIGWLKVRKATVVVSTSKSFEILTNQAELKIRWTLGAGEERTSGGVGGYEDNTY